MMIKRILAILLASLACAVVLANAAEAADTIEYRVLATNRTSTMESELNDAAQAGFRFGAVMGGGTSFGGNEVVAVMQRAAGSTVRYQYRLLAANRTGTMQKELQDAASDGFHYVGQTVFKTTFGGTEVISILERDPAAKERWEYRLLATSRTSTMEKELQEVGRQGFEVVGLTVAETAFGGRELVSIMRRRTQ